MINKNTAAISIILLVGAFAAGRYFAPTKIRTITLEVEKKQETVDKDKRTIIVETVLPDGSKKKTTEIVEGTKKAVNTTRNASTDNTTEYRKNTLAINALIGGQLPLSIPIYGISVQKQLLGPITFGVWGLTNKTAGLSVGITF